MDGLILRKVAQAASAGFITSQGFGEFWPLPEGLEKETPSWSATDKETRDRLIKEFIKR